MVEARPGALGLVGLVRSLDLILENMGGHFRVLSKNWKPSVLYFKKTPLATI